MNKNTSKLKASSMSVKNEQEDDLVKEDIDDLFNLFRKKDNHFITVNDICEQGVNEFREDFYRLEESDQDIIPIIVDSYGGDVYSLYAMISIIETSYKKVATICDSKALSCGVILLSAGDKGLRFMSKYAYILVHQISHQYYGKFSDIAVSAKHCAELNTNLLRLLDENSDNKLGTFEAMLKKHDNADLYLNAKSALRLGIVDHINVPRIKIDSVNTLRTTLLH